ncbi:hypothetical protein [Nocardia sputorum]|uniref:Uncharacterized protein n=1 Tax=Nocardia sputorum TaxID=2984338 RepID=A0ABM8CV14_9NOCA|nr:hypothetical protein [Nocardia sputorum]BDT98816.1 hypothetical protein IFM12276_18450 [Nocardia sputorum]
MEHGQQTGESIGAMLSSIASALREVSEKLDAVAARIDGAQAVASEPTVEGRLAKLEAWAFRAGQDISGLDARVERLESGADPAPEDQETAQRPAAPLPRAAARRSSARRPEHSAEPTAPKSESPGTAGTRNGTPREPVHAAPEPSPAAPTSFTPPREPTLTALEPNAQGFTAPGNSASNFTAPPAREPAFTTPTPREPVSSFTAPTPRDPGTGQQETFPASREPAPAAGSYSPVENAPYESIVASAAATDHSGSENGAAPEATGTGLTGAHRAGVDDRTPVENTHVDKLQAMLDELKRTAAAPLGRADVFGNTPGESTTNGYQSERTEAQRRPADYRLSSPPPVS